MYSVNKCKHTLLNVNVSALFLVYATVVSFFAYIVYKPFSYILSDATIKVNWQRPCLNGQRQGGRKVCILNARYYRHTYKRSGSLYAGE
jgi:hypothetical protein